MSVDIDVFADGSSESFSFDTEVSTLAELLYEQNLIVAEEGQYGIFITSVNGRVADSSKQEWWCITKNGEEVFSSASETYLTDGDKYELTLKTGW